MNDRVPIFNEMEDDCQITTSTRPTKQEDIMELLWQNGQLVVQRSSLSKKKNHHHHHHPYDSPPEQSPMREIRTTEEQQQHQNLFIQEDEMASWLQYPLDDSSFDRDFYADLLVGSVPPPPPPTVAPASQEIVSPRLQNFAHFSRMTSRPSIATTVVESNETPAVRRQESRVSRLVEDSTAPVNTESGTAEDDRKRKAAAETDDIESRSEDIEFEAAEMKKQARGSAATKRSRAAEVHNLSERRRRDRINEKMKALQELIPRCNKSDKASMLDEAIEYLKSLQMQVQMMSMGCGVIPMMYPGMQQYMPAMGMGMGMGMNQSMVPYPSMVPGSSIPNPAAAAHMGPRYPMPGYQLQPVPVPDPSRAQASNQMNPVMNSHVAQGPNQPQMPNFVDPYQQFYGLHQAQIPLPQNQAVAQPSANKPGTSNTEKQQAS